jgi:hypothetical protein
MPEDIVGMLFTRSTLSRSSLSPALSGRRSQLAVMREIDVGGRERATLYGASGRRPVARTFTRCV